MGNTLLLDVGDINADVYWQDGSQGLSYLVDIQGTYSVTARNACGIKGDTILVSFMDIPEVNLGKDSSICKKDSILLDASYPETEFLWYNMSTDSVLLVVGPGNYWVSLKNRCGMNYDTITFGDAFCECEVKFPNAFTPNGDGLNDVFGPETDCGYQHFLLRVYNSWGEMIFESRDSQFLWDGKYKGDNCTKGIYIYTLEYGFNEEIAKQQKGNLMLIR